MSKPPFPLQGASINRGYFYDDRRGHFVLVIWTQNANTVAALVDPGQRQRNAESQPNATSEPVAAMVTPSVEVEDQAIEDNTVTVQEVVSDGRGWIVIHAQADGKPGTVIGHAAVQDDENYDT